MKRMIMTGVCLVAISALGAITATDAMAAAVTGEVCIKPAVGEPTSWKAECKLPVAPGGGFVLVETGDTACRLIIAPEETGGWENATCTLKNTKGEYVKLEGAGEPFKGNLSKALALFTGRIERLTCGSGSLVAEFISGKRVGGVVEELSECKEVASKAACASSGAKEKIVTSKLKGELGYLNEAKKEVGLRLEPESEGGLVASFQCEGILTKNTFEIKGAVIAQIAKPLSEFSLTGELLYEQTEGKQKWTKFEGSAERPLEVSENKSKFEKAAITGADQLKFSFLTRISS